LYFSTAAANPYYIRFASSPSASIIQDAAAQNPSFFTLWIGNNDVLSYATTGGTGVDQTGNLDPTTYGPNDITDPNVLAQVYSGYVDALSASASGGVLFGIPDVSSAPFFTTVPNNALVLDAETARSCILAGAEFIVSPILDEKMIKLCNRYQKVVAPGAFTPTEVYKSLEAGADIVKIFPASVVGPKMIKSIKGPIPQADLMPTGGINLENINEWIEAGSIAAGVGSAITGPAKKGNYQEITKKAEAFVKKINELK